MTTPTHGPPSSPLAVPAVLSAKGTKHRLRNLILAGLLILAPLYLTGYVLWLLFHFMDGIFAPVVERAIGLHVPGFGVALTLGSILALGWGSSFLAGRRAIATVEGLIRRVPIARSVYGATKGIFEAISRDQAEAFKRVVLIEYPRKGIYSLGFVTGSAAWPGVAPSSEDLTFVFVPTTPNPTSGFLVVAPSAEVRDCPLSIEEGVRLIISGGLLQPTIKADAPSAP